MKDHFLKTTRIGKKDIPYCLKWVLDCLLGFAEKQFEDAVYADEKQRLLDQRESAHKALPEYKAKYECCPFLTAA